MGNTSKTFLVKFREPSCCKAEIINGKKGSQVAGWEGSSSLARASGSQFCPRPTCLDPNTSSLLPGWDLGRNTMILYCAHILDLHHSLIGMRGERRAVTPSCCHRLCMAWNLWLEKHTRVYSDCHCSACLHCSRHRGVNSWLEAVQSLPVQVLLPHKLVQIPLHSQMEILIACQARHLQCTVCGCAL